MLELYDILQRDGQEPKRKHLRYQSLFSLMGYSHMVGLCKLQYPRRISNILYYLDRQLLYFCENVPKLLASNFRRVPLPRLAPRHCLKTRAPLFANRGRELVLGLGCRRVDLLEVRVFPDSWNYNLKLDLISSAELLFHLVLLPLILWSIKCVILGELLPSDALWR